MNIKKYIFLAASALVLASCSSDDFLGENPGNNPSYAQTAISFGGTTGKISRASDKNGADAAAALGNNFIVFGTKTVNDEKQTVFNDYQVKYDENTKWTYNNTTLNQYTKYWDYSATQYDFVAFSLASNTIGEGEGENNIKVEKIENQESPTYTLKGKVSALKNCFIADPVSVVQAKYGNDVKFTFHSTGTKVCVGIYETIPGYSIKDITFYNAAGNNSSKQPVLYASTDCFPQAEGTGTLKIVFGTPVTSELTQDDNTTTEIKTKNLDFSDFSLGTDNKLGTDRKSATKTGELSVMPINITGGLTMKVDYTLESVDNSGETIKITGATVKVPEEYTKWQKNYIYTYIFKITDKTNGSTGGSSTGLNPIVFDAMVTEDHTGSHTTETEFKEDGKGTTEDITNSGN